MESWQAYKKQGENFERTTSRLKHAFVPVFWVAILDTGTRNEACVVCVSSVIIHAEQWTQLEYQDGTL